MLESHHCKIALRSNGNRAQALASRAELQNYTLINSDTETASTLPESSKFRRLLDGKVEKA